MAVKAGLTDASVAIVAWPGLEFAALLGDGHVLGRAQRVTTSTSTLDARDHRLARAGVTVDLVDGTWTIRCGDHGSRSFAAHVGEVPPAEVLDALSGVARGTPLELAVRVRRAGRSHPVRIVDSSDDAGGEPEVVGRLVDEDVSVLDGRRVVSRQRYVVIHGSAELVATVRRRLVALGLGDRAVGTTPVPEPPGPPDPVPWPLDDRPAAAAVVQRSLARSVARLLTHDPVVRLDLHVEGVHQMRVATRRLRSDLRTFRALLAPLPDGVADDLGWIARTLGEVRDPDVLRDGLVAAIEHLDPADRRATNSLVKRLGREREAALDRVHEAMATDRYHVLVDRLVVLAEDPPLLPVAQESASAVLRPGAQRAWRRLRTAARTAGRPKATVDDVHAMRIRAKQFRYALDALAEIEPAAVAHAKRLTRLQDVLGAFNDAAVAERWLRGMAVHETDPRRMFVLGQLVMVEHARIERGRVAWPTAWAPVDRRRQRAWLER